MSTKLSVLCLGAAFVASAATTTYFTPLGLTPEQEPPPPVRISPATGLGTASYDTVTRILSVSLEWENLTAPPGAAHIHCCSGPGANSDVAIDFVPAGFPSVVTGTFNDSFDLTDAASYGGGFLDSFGGDVDAARAAFLTGINSNRAYFNIHTPTYGGGEIRGDIQLIPEPGSVVLLGLGLAAGVLYRRRITG
jgi:CHRD domain/PEP-CTERM motif